MRKKENNKFHQVKKTKTVWLLHDSSWLKKKQGVEGWGRDERRTRACNNTHHLTQFDLLDRHFLIRHGAAAVANNSSLSKLILCPPPLSTRHPTPLYPLQLSLFNVERCHLSTSKWAPGQVLTVVVLFWGWGGGRVAAAADLTFWLAHAKTGQQQHPVRYSRLVLNIWRSLTLKTTNDHWSLLAAVNFTKTSAATPLSFCYVIWQQTFHFRFYRALLPLPD